MVPGGTHGYMSQKGNSEVWRLISQSYQSRLIYYQSQTSLNLCQPLRDHWRTITSTKNRKIMFSMVISFVCLSCLLWLAFSMIQYTKILAKRF